MNKKLGRLLRPSVGIFFVFLMLFAGVSLYMQQYILAAVEFGVTLTSVCQPNEADYCICNP